MKDDVGFFKRQEGEGAKEYAERMFRWVQAQAALHVAWARGSLPAQPARCLTSWTGPLLKPYQRVSAKWWP